FFASKIAYLLTEYASPLDNESMIDKVKGKVLLVRGEYDMTMLKHHEEEMTERIKHKGQCASYEAVELPIGHFNSYDSVWFDKASQGSHAQFFEKWLNKD